IWPGWRKFAVAGTPSKFSTADGMADSGRSVPGHSKIPFHIRVVGKKISGLVECDVISISESCGLQGPLFSFGIKLGDPGAGRLSLVCVAPWIPAEWRHTVFSLLLWSTDVSHFYEIGMAACDHIYRLAIRPHVDGVSSVLAVSVHRFQILYGIKRI